MENGMPMYVTAIGCVCVCVCEIGKHVLGMRSPFYGVL